MQLVPDAAFRAERRAQKHLVEQCVRMLIPAELAPARMKFSRHAEIFLIPRGRPQRGQREMVVAPAARRQAFQFVMRLRGVDAGVALRHVPAVVKDGRRRLILMHRAFQPRRVFEIYLFLKRPDRLFVVRVDPPRAQIAQALFAMAGHHVGNIEKESRAGVFFGDFLRLPFENIHVFRIEAQPVIARRSVVGERKAPALPVSDPPLGMQNGEPLVVTRADVDACADARFLQTFQLFAQQVERKVRMHLSGLCGMIRIAVVAFREHRHARNVRLLQRFGKRFPVEIPADLIDQRARMKIEMHLSVRDAHRLSSFAFSVC